MNQIITSFLNLSQRFLLILTLGSLLSCSQEKNYDLNTNNLNKESSPYLLQHAQNPVFWQKWDPEVYRVQNDTDKLLIVSIGYSSCHWCHVMEEETFEDQEVADYMNAHFVSMKVDREEHPDIDQLYMTATQMMTGSGGWPLNVVCLPDGRPVYGGTYHTKTQWLEVLGKIQKLYTNDKSQLEDFAQRVAMGIQEVNHFEINPEPQVLSKSILEDEMKYWSREWDTLHGGERRTQKFITPVKFNYLLHYQQLTQDTSVKDYLEKSLVNIANSGIVDHLQGGFFRYTVDPEWKIPHFEKMLYDNAQLLGLYSTAFKVFPKSVFKDRVFQTFDFLHNTFKDPSGGYYSAIDADNSLGEGQYYVFSKEELQTIAQEDFELLLEFYNIDLSAPFETHFYHLRQGKITPDFFNKHQLTEETLYIKKSKWETQFKELLLQREVPLIDTKILTSWNAQLIVGLTQSYEAFGSKKFLQEAEAIYRFIKTTAFKKNQLFHTVQQGKPKVEGFLEDYAFLIQAANALYRITLNTLYLDDAEQWTQTILKKFRETESPFFTFTEDPTLVSKLVSIDDNVIPSANAIMADNLWTLGQWLGKEDYQNQVQKMWEAVLPNYQEGRSSDYSQWSQLFAKLAFPHYELVILGPKAQEFTAEFQKYHYPNVLFQGSTTTSDLPLLKDRFVKDETHLYVCENKVCYLPVQTLEEALEQIRELKN
ncbi:thioredoxin domain-containing protein [Flavobacteriaceae bacterium]|jgi:uncharacterized protein YyaL (SSP411 family)|nr:thioredoxin domain-containing protein [Flavobacteriaceae bacterium]